MESRSNDIEEGIRLASHIYNTAFASESVADVRYKNFQNDVLTLRQLLEKLQESLGNAQRRYIERGRTIAIRTYEPLSEDFEHERKTFVGDVEGTLKACDILLKDNIKIRFRYSNDAEELSWHMIRQERRVIDLRNRLQIHSRKIRFAIDRLTQELLTDRYASERSLLDIAQRNVETFHEILPDLHQRLAGQSGPQGSNLRSELVVSNAISKKFEEHWFVDAPPDIGSGIALHLAFDALVDAFLASSGGSDQTPEKYLLFLKSCWLLDRLKQTKGYQDASPAVYYRYAVAQLEASILTRMRQPGELILFDENVLFKLPLSVFRIWPSKTTATAIQYMPSHPLSARANEEKLACIKLASGNSESPDVATVFKSSDRHYRIVVKSTLDPSIGSTSLVPQTVYSSEDKLIPRYALPTVTNANPEMAIFSRNEETLFRFKSFTDLYQFQTALTGYDVSHDQANVRCQFSDDLAFLDCVGRLQLWQNPITAPPTVDNDDLHRNRSLRTQRSMTESSYSRHESLLSSVAPSNTVSWTTNGWEADDVKLPTIKIFTQLADKSQKHRFAIISVSLEPGVYLDPSECGCERDYMTCSKLVLTRNKKKLLPVRTLYSEVDATGHPNPNTFDIFPFRLPHHPHNFSTKHSEYLVLKFKSLPEKQSFHRELDLRFRVRDKQIEDQRNFASTMIHRQDRPQGRRKVLPPGQSQPPSPSVSSFQTSLPPVLDEPETGPTLVDSLVSRRHELNHQQRLNEARLSPVVPSPRSASSSRTAHSLCTSLDSMVLAHSDVGVIDRHLTGDATGVLTPDTASSVYSAAARSNSFHEQHRVSNHSMQEHKEFYGPPGQPNICGLVRSPSAAAPEYYSPTDLHDKAYEAPGYNTTAFGIHSSHRMSHQAPTPVDLKTCEAFEPTAMSQLPRSQSGTAPQWHDPDSINVYYGQTDQSRHVPSRLITVRDERFAIQNESSVSRNKTTKRKANLSSLKFWSK